MVFDSEKYSGFQMAEVHQLQQSEHISLLAYICQDVCRFIHLNCNAKINEQANILLICPVVSNRHYRTAGNQTCMLQPDSFISIKLYI